VGGWQGGGGGGGGVQIELQRVWWDEESRTLRLRCAEACPAPKVDSQDPLDEHSYIGHIYIHIYECMCIACCLNPCKRVPGEQRPMP
jgi:hypothetical protein